MSGTAGPPGMLVRLLSRHLPAARVVTELAGADDGQVAIDVAVDGFHTRVVWSPACGFGFFLGEAANSAFPNETYANPHLAAARLRTMVKAFHAGLPPGPMSIAEVRKLLGRRQREVADLLSVQQTSISRFECRRNPTLGALRAVVEAIGGRLEVRIRSANLDVPITVPDPNSEE